MNTKNLFCREVVLDSRELVIPRTTYQRTLNEDRVRRIAPSSMSASPTSRR